jgi:DNA helicase HerA-like ATPase
MYTDDRIRIGMKENGENIYLNPSMACRHGLIAGATGSGKTITLKVLAESFSEMGVPVFLADVKGDLAGMCMPGNDTEDMQRRIEKFGLKEAGFDYHGYPAVFWDLYGKKGTPLRTTVTEMGPDLMATVLGLNDLQTALLSIIYKIADDEGLLLIDTKDLKAIINYVSENHKEYEENYGKIAPVSLAAIVREIVALEMKGAEQFFGEPAIDIRDFISTGPEGRGVINILDSSSLINDPTLYSMFMLYLLAELFETLPEAGDLAKPKLVFFFDEAHLLFSGATKDLLTKIEQVVKLIRSKGVGVYFATQNPSDIPDGVMSQLGNKIEHALHAYTPAEQKKVKAAAEGLRENPEFNTYETLMALGTGEAVVSFLGEDGVPGIAQKVSILPPQSQMGEIDEGIRSQEISRSTLHSKYANPYDPDSAYEFLKRKGVEEEEAKAAAEKAAAEEKEAMKAQQAAEKEAQKAKEREEREAQREKEKESRKVKTAAKSVGSSVAGTVGREVGKSVGSSFGKFGKTLGGNVGASIGRGIIGTLFKF